jgi:hypothetical protein
MQSLHSLDPPVLEHIATRAGPRRLTILGIDANCSRHSNSASSARTPNGGGRLAMRTSPLQCGMDNRTSSIAQAFNFLQYADQQLYWLLWTARAGWVRIVVALTIPTLPVAVLTAWRRTYNRDISMLNGMASSNPQNQNQQHAAPFAVTRRRNILACSNCRQRKVRVRLFLLDC